MRTVDEDDELRAAAFAFLRDVMARTGGLVHRTDLRGFTFRERRLSLEQHMRGIRVVSGHPAALSILTVYESPYDDHVGDDGYPRYKWRKTNPLAFDNVALREAMESRKPLIWFWGVAPALYEPLFPVWLVAEEREDHQVVVAVDEGMEASWQADVHLSQPDQIRRREYALAVVRRRLHQPQFRRDVLAAYRERCALCALRHPELLDAAHIKEDAEGGQPVVPNGIAMCAIHHRAFDAHVMGIRPDYVIEVRRKVREEHDGPTLQYALQGMHGQTLTRPRARAAWPSPDLLEERFERFRQVS